MVAHTTLLEISFMFLRISPCHLVVLLLVLRQKFSMSEKMRDKLSSLSWTAFKKALFTSFLSFGFYITFVHSYLSCSLYKGYECFRLVKVFFPIVNSLVILGLIFVVSSLYSSRSISLHFSRHLNMY